MWAKHLTDLLEYGLFPMWVNCIVGALPFTNKLSWYNNNTLYYSIDQFARSDYVILQHQTSQDQDSRQSELLLGWMPDMSVMFSHFSKSNFSNFIKPLILTLPPSTLYNWPKVQNEVNIPDTHKLVHLKNTVIIRVHALQRALSEVQ